MVVDTTQSTDERWSVVLTKPNGEMHAKNNLEAQGMLTYLPLMNQEFIRRGSREIKAVPLFSRYLFLLYDDQAKAMAPTIRSTRGVSQLLMTGESPAIVDAKIVNAIRSLEDGTQNVGQSYFKSGDPVRVIDGPFNGLEGIYAVDDGELRSMVLLEIMHKSHSLGFKKTQLQKKC
jgi:transcriptional antiterminator RfaH